MLSFLFGRGNHNSHFYRVTFTVANNHKIRCIFRIGEEMRQAFLIREQGSDLRIIPRLNSHSSLFNKAYEAAVLFRTLSVSY